MNKTGKTVTIILWVLIAISVILVVSMMANFSENEQDPTMQYWVSTNLIWSYILIIVGAGIAIIAGLIHMFTDKRAAKNGLIAVAFLGGVTLISYLLASPEMPQFLGVDKFINDGLTGQKVKLIDTGLYATYIFFGLAIVAIIFSSVSRIFK